MHTIAKQPFLSSFGRNRGRSLRPYQQSLVDELLPKLAVDMEEIVQITTSSRWNSGAAAGAPLPAGEAGFLNEQSEFRKPGEGVVPHTDSRPHPDLQPNAPLPASPLREEGWEGGVWANPTSPAGRGSPAADSRDHRIIGSSDYRAIALEIGFGAGEHLLAQAAHHPDTLFIGCEPYINGVAKCLSGIAASKLTNIRLFTDDARKLLQALPENSIDSAFILFPDPWPKLRHNKRRLVNHETLAMLARVQRPGARLLLATDHVDYSIWMLEHLLVSPHYRWTARECADWDNPPADWTQTKYQRKTTEQGRLPVFMECVRVG